MLDWLNAVKPKILIKLYCSGSARGSHKVLVSGPIRGLTVLPPTRHSSDLVNLPLKRKILCTPLSRASRSVIYNNIRYFSNKAALGYLEISNFPVPTGSLVLVRIPHRRNKAATVLFAKLRRLSATTNKSNLLTNKQFQQ